MIAAIIVHNRFDNLVKWIRCWKLSDTGSVTLYIIHNCDDETERKKFKSFCKEQGVNYVPRQNVGFDIGAFEDVCKGRLKGFPTDWDYLFWVTDDTIPMAKDFLKPFVMVEGVVCLEISKQVKPHIRTCAFMIDRDTASRLVFPKLLTKEDCYQFEHKSRNAFYEQVLKMNKKVVQTGPVANGPLWDTGHRKTLKRWDEHNGIFMERINKICIVTTFDRNYKEAGKTLFNSIRRHTDCEGIDFKVITADEEVLNEFENCHFITEEIKARYKDVKYSKDLPVEKYSSSWYRYEIFNMTEYDRVICIDSDCICIRDISYLFSEELNEYDLISVEDHIVSKCFNKLVPQLERQGLRLSKLTKRMSEGKVDIQPALLVANKTIINNKWYKKLLKYANTTPFSYSIDEGVLNDFIYEEKIRIKLLPLEWDYQDIYEKVVPGLPVPSDPYIVHCQESKPFKKSKKEIDRRMHKWHDLWWKEARPIAQKTIVAVIVWNRFESLRRWINCWKACNKTNAELIVVHNLESDNERYSELCKENGIKYVPRENKGFDIGAFQDICRERLKGFPNNWNNLLWVTDDCIPMSKDFVRQFLSKLTNRTLPCYEISNEVKRHVRTTGFMVTKEISRKLFFPQDPIETRVDCYGFEHNMHNALYEQIVSMGIKPVMVNPDLKNSPLWDSGARAHFNLMRKHEKVFPAIRRPIEKVSNMLDELAIKHKSDKSSRFHNYAVKYDKILSRELTSVLEIGVAQGQSLRMWTDYFPKATIHGADISKASESCVSYSNRIRFHLLDQRDRAQLKNMEQFSPFDLIIDDGNHFWMEQILTFETLFPYVKSGGIYIVEDTTTSYWKEYKNHPVSPVEYFKKLVDDVHLNGRRAGMPTDLPKEFGDWERGWHRREDCHTDVPDFESIQFYNGFIVIYKR